MLQTLEKTIDLFENGCIRPCVECPCYGMKECQDQLSSELYYLKAYKRLMDSKKELEWIGIIDENNKPLTWDEIFELKNKPIWIDNIEKGYGYWTIVDNCGIMQDGTKMFTSETQFFYEDEIFICNLRQGHR